EILDFSVHPEMAGSGLAFRPELVLCVLPAGAGGHIRQRIAPGRFVRRSDNSHKALRQISACFRTKRPRKARPDCWRTCPPAPAYLCATEPITRYSAMNLTFAAGGSA